MVMYNSTDKGAKPNHVAAVERIRAVLFFDVKTRQWDPALEWDVEKLDEINEILSDHGLGCPDDRGVICTSDNVY